MDDYENESLPVGESQVAEAMQTLQRYKAGKAALDKRIVDNELWFRMGHWKNYQNPMMPGKAQPSSGWLFNSIANKHADAMDNYPEPNVKYEGTVESVYLTDGMTIELIADGIHLGRHQLQGL